MWCQFGPATVWTAVERRADRFAECGNLIGLAQNGKAVSAGEGFGIATGQQHRKPRVTLVDGFGQSQSVEFARQHHVGEHQIDRRAGGEKVQRRLGIFDGNAPVVELLEQCHCDGLHIRIVFDDQNSLTAPGRLAGRCGVNRDDRGVAARQVQRRLRSVVDLAANTALIPSTVSVPSRVTFSPDRIIAPPSGMASRAFTTRFTSASSNSGMSIATGQTSGGNSMRRSILPRAELESTSRNAMTVLPGWTVRGFCGWRRAKVSNCRVSVSPREAAAMIASSERMFF